MCGRRSVASMFLAYLSYSTTAGANADHSRSFKRVYPICPNHLKTVENCSGLGFDKQVAVGRRSLWQQVMLNTCTVISCVCKSKFFTLLLYWVAAPRDDIPPVHYSLCPTLSSAMLNMHRWLRDPLPKGFERRRGRKISRLYETNVWHSTEHCSAVDLSVNRRLYARACWQPIWHWLPRKFQKGKRGTVHLASPAVILLRYFGHFCAGVCIPSLICNQLIVELKMLQM